MRHENNPFIVSRLSHLGCRKATCPHPENPMAASQKPFGSLTPEDSELASGAIDF